MHHRFHSFWQRFYQAMSQQQFVLAMMLIFVVIGMVMVITTYMPSLFLGTYPPTYLPYLYVAQAIMLTVVTLFTNRISATFPRQFTLSCQVFFAVSLIIVEPLLHKAAWVIFVYCAYLNLVSVFSVINAWNLVAQAFDIRTFKANSIALTSAGTIAGVIFGYGLPIAVSFYGIGVLPFLIAGFIIFAIFPVLKINLLPIPVEPRKAVQFKIKEYPLTKNMFFYMFLIIMTTTLIDYVFKSSLGNYYHGNKDKIATYMGVFIASSNLLTLFLQFFLTKRLMTHLSVVGLLLVLPTVLFVAAGVVSVNYTLITATTMALLSNTLTYSIYNIATEAVLNVLPLAIKLRAKSLVKGISRTAGTILAAFLLWVLNLYFGGRVIAITIILFTVLAAIVAWILKKNYRSSLQDSLVLKRFNEDTLVEQAQSEGELRDIILGALRHPDVGLNLLGLSLMSRVKFDILPHELLQLLASDNHDVRLSAIIASENIEDDELTDALINLLNISTDSEEIYLLLKVFYVKSPKKAYKLAIRFQDDRRPSIRAIVLYIEMMQGDLASVAQAVNGIREMVYSDKKEDRQSATQILGDLHVGDLQNEFSSLIQDEASIVSISAIYAAGKRADTNLLPLVVQQLNRVKVAFHVAKALVMWGDNAIPLLIKKISEDKDINGRIGAVKALSHFTSEKSDLAFIEVFKISDYLILHQICKYLARRTRVVYPSPLLKKQLEKSLAQDVELIVAMKSLLIASLTKEQKWELALRIRLLSKTFLYQLAALHEPDVFLKVIPILENSIDTKNIQVMSSTLELVETSLSHKKYKEYLASVYENQHAEQISPQKALMTIKHYDPYFYDFLQGLQKRRLEPGEPMDNIEKLMLLRKTQLFKKLPAESLLAIAEVTNCREMTNGEEIYHQEGLPDALYMIGKGTVALSRDSKPLVELKEGQFFGFIGVLDNEPWYTTATCKEDGLLLYIEKPAFDRILEDIPDVLIALSHVLLNYLKGILETNRWL